MAAAFEPNAASGSDGSLAMVNREAARVMPGWDNHSWGFATPQVVISSWS